MSTTTKERFIERQIARGMARESAERGAELLLRLKASPSDIHDAQARKLAEKMLRESGIST